MEKLLGASQSTNCISINVADLVGRKPGDNPHLWYDPATMSAFAKALSAALAAADPVQRSAYEQRLQVVLELLKPIDAKVAQLRQKHAGTPITATEPVFGYMATRKQLTGCLFFVATAESESRAVCQLVELRMSRFLTDRVCVMCKSQAARFIRRRLKMNKNAAPTRNMAGISLSRA